MTLRRRRSPEDVDDEPTRVRVVEDLDEEPQSSSATPAAPGTASAPAGPEDERPRAKKQPLYPRLLRLRHISPNAWQRAALGEGAIAVGVLLAMADLATAWGIVVLPVAVAVIVKAHDALQGLLERRDDASAPPAG